MLTRALSPLHTPHFLSLTSILPDPPHPPSPTPRYLTLRARLLYWKEALVRYNRLFGSTMEQYIETVMVPELIARGRLVPPVGPAAEGSSVRTA